MYDCSSCNRIGAWPERLSKFWTFLRSTGCQPAQKQFYPHGLAARATIALLVLLGIACIARAEAPLRPPAIPLVTHSPYFSIWLPADTLTDTWPMHWTGVTNGMSGLIRIDGETYRFLGQEPEFVSTINPMKQTALRVLPTRTIASFERDGVELQVTFCSPLLPDDLKVMSTPATYVQCSARAIDGKKHDVAVYLDVCAELAVNDNEQAVETQLIESDGLRAMRCGSEDQEVLERDGDRVRIDWGYAYLLAAGDEPCQLSTGDAAGVRQAFVDSANLPDDTHAGPRPVEQRWPVIAGAFALGEIGESPASRTFVLAYDEIKQVEYLGEPLDPLWKKYYPTVEAMLTAARDEAQERLDASAAFDEKLMASATEAGDEQYAALCALAYRQAIAGHGLAMDADGTPLMFSKENSSNGCIGTVDVIYPTAPLFLLLSPELMEANLEPVLRYAAMDRWKFPFAPHDLGRYPKANGQRYGGGEKTEENQMPVEESANMLILVAALQHADPGSQLAQKHWPQLTQWANYLKEKGLDPENQLCTDDFAGHLAHNANLSIKAIVGIGCYARLCETLGKADDAKSYRALAEQMAKQWIEMADDGDHTRLAFDKPGTWSQKYNLVWDRILDLKLFPDEVAEREIAFYLKTQEKYGIALDNRSKWTKLDWIVWSASLAEDESDFRALVAPVYAFANETPDRVPLSDWYFVDSGNYKQFRARTVVGGVFIKMLTDEKTWKQWAAK